MLPHPPLWLILVAFVCALGPLVFFHEFGHYLVGRVFRVPAESFSIGFGREILGWTDKRGTRWKVGWLPLGGYVKFVGDMGPASTPAEDEDVLPEVRDRTFHFRPVWQRFLIVLAGPLANFLLAILIFAALFAAVGFPSTSNQVLAVQPGGAADRAGILVDDRITMLAGRDVESFEDIQRIVLLRPEESVGITVERAGKPIHLEAHLGAAEEHDRFGRTFKKGLLGVYGGEPSFVRLSPLELIPAATDYTFDLTRSMVEGLWQIVTGRRSAKQIGGPITIATVAGEGASEGIVPFVSLLALFSINLGFINLLPVPMLDGGHLVFYAVEAVQRRPVSANTLDWAFRGGLALLLALVVFTTINDLGSLGLWDGLQRLIG